MTNPPDIGSDFYTAAQDPATFARRYCYTIHQTERGPSVELIPDYPYLAPFWDVFRSGEDFVAEKTRQVMASWACAAGFLHDVLFRRDWPDLLISRRESLVDDGGSTSTYQSLLGKVRFIYERLPRQLRDLVRLEFSHLKVHNPATQSTLIGESSNPQAGRGGNFRRALLDEAAFIPNGEQVYAAVRLACPRGIITNGTPNGRGNLLYRLRSTPGMRLVRMHWSQHPERACSCDETGHKGCWYAAQCETMTPAQIARELDISYDESVGGKVWYTFDRPSMVRDVPFLPGVPVLCFWDFGVGDETAILFCQIERLHTARARLVPRIRIFGDYAASQVGALHYRQVVSERAKAWGGVPIRHVGDPHNLRARDSSLTSWQINLADDKHPYKIWVDPSGCAGHTVEEVVDNARRFMSSIEAQDGSHQPRLLVDGKLTALIECFEAWAYPTDDEGGITGAAPKPIHDWMSHRSSAFYYGAWSVDPPSGGPMEISPERDGAMIHKIGDVFANPEGVLW